MWILEPTQPAVVLGSTQPLAIVDAERARVAGVEVVRRRSGGGAVLVDPAAVVWVDVMVPTEDPLWDLDVGRAFHWLGRAWAGALADLRGVVAEVHEGPLRQTPWSAQVCFAGLGPGEVTVGDAKVVGMCQRRTRTGALFQCAALLSWEPAHLLDVLSLCDDDRRRGLDQLSGAATGVEVGSVALVEALLARLP